MSTSLNLEATAGITQFVNNHEGFFGIIKQRYSDFLVNEISSDGNVVHLTCKDVIEPPSVIITKDLKKPDAISDVQLEIINVMAGLKHPKELKPSLFLTPVEEGAFFEKPPEDFSSLKVRVEGLSKESRTSIHQFIKSNFSSLNTSTKEFNLEKFIIVTKKANEKKRDKRNEWPKSQSYVNFVLYKENVDTMEAVNLIACKLRLKSGMFCYAGNKDKRAKTSQKLSIQRVLPKNILSVTNSLNGIHAGNFSFGPTPQKLGQLKGNMFRIVLREVQDSDGIINTAVESLKSNGFINYYGMQRFSYADVPTHLIGKAMLKCKWSEVCDLILTPRNNEPSYLAEAKKIWKQRKDPVAALQCIPRYKQSSIEGHLLSGLAQHGKGNASTAFEKIPRNTQLLYLHAYQSYLWNIVVSKRIEKHGVKVLKGDITRHNLKSTNNDEEAVNLELMEEDQFSEEDATLAEKTDSKIDHQNVHIITENEIDDIDISQVLMPLPGYAIAYPENELKEMYLELLKKDGLNFDSFKHKIKKFSLIGAYRRVILRPENLKHEICFYDDSTKPLIQSDLEALKNIEVKQNKLSVGAHKAVILEFSLQSSAYATMALRELLKIETSSAFQSTLNSKSSKEEQNKAQANLNCKNEHDNSVDSKNNIDEKKRKLEVDSENDVDEKKRKLEVDSENDVDEKKRKSEVDCENGVDEKKRNIELDER